MSLGTSRVAVATPARGHVFPSTHVTLVVGYEDLMEDDGKNSAKPTTGKSYLSLDGIAARLHVAVELSVC